MGSNMGKTVRHNQQCGRVAFASLFIVVQSLTNSLGPHGLQHTRLICPPLPPRVWSNSCPFNQWCYLTILPSATPFPFCLQSFPSSGSLPMSWLFASGDQSFEASAYSLSPINEYSRLISFRINWLDLLAIQGTLKSLLQHHSSKASILWHSAFSVFIFASLRGDISLFSTRLIMSFSFISYTSLFFSSIVKVSYLNMVDTETVESIS